MSGVVYLIGGGPGSADLISLRGLRLLRSADLVVMDTLLPETYLEELGIVGKEVLRPETVPGDDMGRQEEIDRLMVQAAGRGERVARLKGGDPFLFGRGWEEVSFLDRHGVPWEVVPGISSAMAVPASASVPLTTRHTGRSVAFVTARLAGGDPNRKMPKADTIVVMMGMKVLPTLARYLTAEGWPPDTPVCVIERGCQPGERHVRATLADIADAVREAGLKPPGVVIVGPGVYRPDLRHPRPRILFTGHDPAPFRPLGEILHWPLRARAPRATSTEELNSALAHLAPSGPRAILFTEPAAVGEFLERLSGTGRDARALAGTALVAGSEEVALALRERSLRADCVCRAPENAEIATLLEEMGVAGEPRVLVVDGGRAPDGLEERLQAAGANVHLLTIFDERPGPLLGEPLPEHDVLCFVSAGDLHAFHDAYGADGFARPVWCLGEDLVARLKKVGIEGTVVVPPGLEADRSGAKVATPLSRPESTPNVGSDS